MFRILAINYEYPPLGGGGGVVSRDLVEGWVQGGHNVTVITSAYGNLPEKEEINGVDVHRVQIFGRKKQNAANVISLLSYYPSAVRKGIQLFHKKPFDLIHTGFAIPSGPIGHRLARKFDVPNVLTLMGGDVYDPSKTISPHKTPGLKQTVRKMLIEADYVAGGSSEICDGAHKYYGVTRAMEVIPFGIQPFKCRKSDRSDYDISDDQFVMLTIGRLVRRKNIELLIDVVDMVRARLNVLLLVMGDGPLYDSLQSQINEKGLNNHIRLLGRVSDEDKLAYLSISDIYVSTSMHEGFGLVFLEGMQCGLPIVCFDVGGQTDFLKDGITGFVVPLNDKTLFAEKISRILDDSVLRKEIGDFNQEHVKQYYVRNACKRYLEIFDRVIAARG
jgi:glycosyltransferase involved in cell wall biosynthesis